MRFGETPIDEATGAILAHSWRANGVNFSKGRVLSGEDVAKLAYFGLHALQHRGQESAGIAVSDGRRIVVHKEMGLVAQVFDEPSLTALHGRRSQLQITQLESHAKLGDRSTGWDAQDVIQGGMIRSVVGKREAVEVLA